MKPQTILFLIVLFLLLLILFKYYWKIQLNFNSSVLSMYTPDTFPIDEKYQKQYNHFTSLGKEYCKRKKVIITALVRDVGKKLPEIEKKAIAVSKLFNDYRIIIVENDSSDNTREYLLSWSKKDPKVIILGCGINVKKCEIKLEKTEGHSVNRKRIEKMVYLRNIYLDFIKKNYSHFDYVLMWDLDSISMIYLDGIHNSFGYFATDNNIATICANGIYRWGFMTLYYDTYATLSKNEKFHIDSKLSHDIRKGLWEHRYYRGEPLQEVDSCFSGFTIYRMENLLGKEIYYDMSPMENIECEHVRLNMKIKGKKYINPSMINYILLND